MMTRRSTLRSLATTGVLLLLALPVTNAPYARDPAPGTGIDLGPAQPLTPTRLTPTDSMLIGDLPQSSVVLRWAQGLLKSTAGAAPAVTTRFVVCFFDPLVAHDCRRGTGAVAFFDLPAASVTRDEPHPLTWYERLFGKRSPVYEFEHTVMLPSTALDHPLEWTVGACSQPQPKSCALGRPQPISLTARDLAVDRIDDQDFSSGEHFEIHVRNDGRTSAESFVVASKVWEVLLQPRSTRALTDLGDPAVRPGDLVVTRSAEEIRVDDYLARGLEASDVLGIHRPGDTQVILSNTVAEVPPGVPAGQGLQTGTCATAGSCPAHTQAYPACEPTPCNVTTTRHPSVLAIVTVVNRDSPWDFERADNLKAKSNIYVP